MELMVPKIPMGKLHCRQAGTCSVHDIVSLRRYL